MAFKLMIFISSCLAAWLSVESYLPSPTSANHTFSHSVEEQIREGKFTTNLLTQKSTFKHVTAALSLSSGESYVNRMFRLVKQLPSRSSAQHNAQANNGDAHAASGNASEWLKLQKWLYSHARDILDESDEILHARF
ncbi:hypothetical protein L210DRAFT_3710176 [Boletus edulis BED1]|uniref:Uncharacterized protein n=1 Tax=Boletus edulis BED1 TaxID=1328754 RepID=A0AAD4BAZ3_BOLED|nr:hypothetical protein L210DRAFT_3710176 [Boletus edulis BED1]